jgi:hypothetical protein
MILCIYEFPIDIPNDCFSLGFAIYLYAQPTSLNFEAREMVKAAGLVSDEFCYVLIFLT